MWAARIDFWKSLFGNAKLILMNPTRFYDENILDDRGGVDKFIIGILAIFIVLILFIMRAYTIATSGTLIIYRDDGMWGFWGWFFSIPIIGEMGIFIVAYCILHLYAVFYSCLIIVSMLFDERLIFRDVIAFVSAQMMILLPILIVIFGLLVAGSSASGIQIASANWGTSNLLTVVMFALIYIINVFSIAAIARSRFGFAWFAAYSPLMGIAVLLISIQVWLMTSGSA